MDEWKVTHSLYFKMRFNQSQLKDFIKVVLEGKGYSVDKLEFKNDELVADLCINEEFHNNNFKLKKELEECKEQIERLKAMLVSYEYQDKLKIKEQ